MRNRCINFTIVFLCLFVVFPTFVLAEISKNSNEVSDRNVGLTNEEQLDIEQKTHKTELEKQFPELFEKETVDVIFSVKEANQSSFDQIQEDIFNRKMEKNKMMDDTKEMLFSDDYQAPVITDALDRETENRRLTLKLVGWVIITLLIYLFVHIFLNKLSKRRKANAK
ncbi:type VII secretion protein EssA [Paraliobacillus sp. JSM ZJ581]|uniref:type VII secretion protein EssA n=1 Tax=Paraliobacillus sp. JSM ZJ581 TaxID=3342118 RepID=UPI0035A86F11